MRAVVILSLIAVVYLFLNLRALEDLQWVSRYANVLQELQGLREQVYIYEHQDIRLDLHTCRLELEALKDCDARAYTAEAEFEICSDNLWASVAEVLELRSECGYRN